jgi:hypothetical protein
MEIIQRISREINIVGMNDINREFRLEILYDIMK